MAHEIANIEGQNAFFCVGKPAWHGLGQVVSKAQTAKEAMILAQLHNEVSSEPIYFKDREGEFIEINDRVANVRNEDKKDIYLSVVSKEYQIFQSYECFDFMDSIVKSGEAMYQTAGATRNGKNIFMTLKLPEDVVLDAEGGKDNLEKYLLLWNSYDGKSKLRVLFTPIRVVCQNTLNCAINNAENSGVFISHTGNLNDKIEEAKRTLGFAHKFYNDLAEKFKRLVDFKISDHQAIKYIEKVFPLKPEEKIPSTSMKSKRGEVLTNFLGGRGHELAGKTLWGVYNATTEYVDHSQYERRNSKKSVDELTDMRFRSIVFGRGKTVKQTAFDVACEMAGVSSN